jgi:hypothetical protein
MLKGAGDAMGDFDKTAEGAANKQRILAARMADLQVDVGKLILPIKVLVLEGFLKLADILTPLIPRVVEFGEAIGGKFLGAIKDVGSSIKTFIDNVKWLIENGGSLMDIVAGDNEATFWQKLAFYVAEAIPILKDIASLAWDGFKAFVDAAQRLAGLAWGAITELASAGANLATIAWANISGPLSTIAALSWDKLKDGVQALKDLGEAAKGALPNAKDLGKELDSLEGYAKDVYAAVKDLAEIVRPFAERDLKAMQDAVRDLNQELKPVLEELKKWEPVLKPLAQVIGVLMVAQFVALGVAILALSIILGPFIDFIKTVVIMQFQLLEGALKLVREAADKLGGAFSAASSAMSGPINAIIGMIQGIIDKANAAIGVLNRLPGVSIGGGGGSSGSSTTGGAVPGGEGQQMPGREIFGSQMGGSGALRNSAAVQQAQQDYAAVNPDYNSGGQWINGVFYPSADTGPGTQHATITIVQNIGSVGSKGEAAMMMQDGAYALATRGL